MLVLFLRREPKEWAFRVGQPQVLPGLFAAQPDSHRILAVLRRFRRVGPSEVRLAQPSGQLEGQIRAALLAAVRSAVLWRQLGGSYWDLALRRGAMSRIARALLAAE